MIEFEEMLIYCQYMQTEVETVLEYRKSHILNSSRVLAGIIGLAIGIMASIISFGIIEELIGHFRSND